MHNAEKKFHPPGAPQLHKEYVTLTDVQAVNASNISGPEVSMSLSANGFKVRDVTTSRVP